VVAWRALVHGSQAKGIEDGGANMSSGNRPPGWLREWSKQLTVAQVLFGALSFLVLAIIIYALYHAGGGFLVSLQNLEIARGLITFLVVFTTVVIAIILVFYIATSTLQGQDVKDRFGFGKEILTALIGILGTILGFYFGQSTSTSTALQVAPAYVSNANPKRGESLVLYSFVSGGKPPYTYSISFKPDIIPSVPERLSAQGVIQEEIKIPDSVPKDKDTEFTFQIITKDGAGKSVTYDDTTKKFTVKAEVPKP
jgi:hypothetical protein